MIQVEVTTGRRPGGVGVVRVCFGVAAMLVVIGLGSLGAGLVFGWGEPGSWRTAADFGIGFGLVLAAVSYTVIAVGLGARTRAWLLGGLAAACAVEVFVATVQAGRGGASFTTSIAAGLVPELAFAGAPALAGALIVAVAVVLVVAAARTLPGRAVGMSVAVRVGTAGLLAATGIGVAMEVAGTRTRAAVGSSGAVVGQAASRASMSLLPAHLVALVGIGLPVLAGLAARSTLSPVSQTRMIVLACAGYLAGAGVIVVESLLGLPLLAPAGAAVAGLGATALLVALIAVGYGLLHLGARRFPEPSPAPAPR